MKFCAQVVCADDVVPLQGASVVVTIESTWPSTVCDCWNMSNSIGASTFSEGSPMKAN